MLIVVICFDVGVHESTRGEYILQHILQFMQVFNTQHNGMTYEYMILFCYCKQATHFHCLPNVARLVLFSS